MKLHHILESYELGSSNTRFSKDELEILYKTVTSHKELDRSEVKNLAKELTEGDKWKRSLFSAELGLARMHVIVHGVAPHGVSERTAESWMVPSGPMDTFAKSKGIDVDKNIALARRELKGRKALVKRPDAVRMMADFAKANRDMVTNKVRNKRDEIVGDIMAGLTPEEAFTRHA